MKINVIDHGREQNCCNRLLVVTSDATYCEAKFAADGFVQVYGGSVWPGELPEVFEHRGRATAQRSSNTYVRPEIVDHFRGSVGSLSFERD